MDRDPMKRRARQCKTKKDKARRDPQYAVFMSARRRAREQSIEFNLEVKDIVIPKRCPVLGVKLKIRSGNRNRAPTLDRIIPSLGYVKGNVAVISWRANRIKNDASLEEILALGQWLRSVLGTGVR